MFLFHKSEPYDIIDIFNNISRYPDDTFIIDNPEFERNIPEIYPVAVYLNKLNTSNIATYFLNLSTKVIGSDIHTSVYDKRDEFEFPIANFPG